VKKIPVQFQHSLLDHLEAQMPRWSVMLANAKHPEDAPYEVIVRADTRFGAYDAALIGQPVYIVLDQHPRRLDD